MASTYFQFKQFRVEQEGAVMKVCTDACVQGAYVGHKLQAQRQRIQKILDIGTGSGLLALMLAQVTDAAIDAVELEENACRQAANNFLSSPWKERMHIYRGDIIDDELDGPYDFIISNPPFYEQDLKSSSLLKNQAKHAVTLNYETLLKAMKDHLAPAGQFAVLLPAAKFSPFRQQAGVMGFHLQDALQVRQTPAHSFFRTIGIFGQKETLPVEEALTIKNERDQYTPEFIRLLKPYYLYL